MIVPASKTWRIWSDRSTFPKNDFLVIIYTSACDHLAFSKFHHHSSFIRLIPSSWYHTCCLNLPNHHSVPSNSIENVDSSYSPSSTSSIFKGPIRQTLLEVGSLPRYLHNLHFFYNDIQRSRRIRDEKLLEGKVWWDTKKGIKSMHALVNIVLCWYFCNRS